MEILPQLVASGLVNGAIYSLMAIGYVVIYKGTNVVNFAQGEAVMVVPITFTPTDHEGMKGSGFLQYNRTLERIFIRGVSYK